MLSTTGPYILIHKLYYNSPNNQYIYDPQCGFYYIFPLVVVINCGILYFVYNVNPKDMSEILFDEDIFDEWTK
jgi:hypothetical protein